MSRGRLGAHVLDIDKKHIAGVGAHALHSKSWELFGKDMWELCRKDQKRVILDCWAEKRIGKKAHFMVTAVYWPEIYGIIQAADGEVSDMHRVQIVLLRIRESE